MNLRKPIPSCSNLSGGRHFNIHSHLIKKMKLGNQLEINCILIHQLQANTYLWIPAVLDKSEWLDVKFVWFLIPGYAASSTCFTLCSFIRVYDVCFLLSDLGEIAPHTTIRTAQTPKKLHVNSNKTTQTLKKFHVNSTHEQVSQGNYHKIIQRWFKAFEIRKVSNVD